MELMKCKRCGDTRQVYRDDEWNKLPCARCRYAHMERIGEDDPKSDDQDPRIRLIPVVGFGVFLFLFVLGLLVYYITGSAVFALAVVPFVITAMSSLALLKRYRQENKK